MKKNRTYKLALFGDPVSHSLSPQIHQQFAQQFDLIIDYQLIQVNKNEFSKTVLAFFANGGVGANITLPHKTKAVEISSIISNVAHKSKAVNTLSMNYQELTGDNTDGIGFINDLTNRCQFDCQGKNILILGAGGATQGIVPTIMMQQPREVYIANRTLKKAQEIANHPQCKAISFEQLFAFDKTFDLIIHSSSLGHRGKTLEFSNKHANQDTICYDLSYGNAAKAFIEFSKNKRCLKIYDGIGMLVEQAAKSFEIWFNHIPKTDSVIKSLLDTHKDQQ